MPAWLLIAPAVVFGGGLFLHSRRTRRRRREEHEQENLKAMLARLGRARHEARHGDKKFRAWLLSRAVHRQVLRTADRLAWSDK